MYWFMMLFCMTKTECIACIYNVCAYNMISSILNNYIKGRMEEKTKTLVAVLSESWNLSDLNFFTFLYFINYVISN